MWVKVIAEVEVEDVADVATAESRVLRMMASNFTDYGTVDVERIAPPAYT